MSDKITDKLVLDKTLRRNRGSNPGPLHYEWSALPLSYSAIGARGEKSQPKMINLLNDLAFNHKYTFIVSILILLGLVRILQPFKWHI